MESRLSSPCPWAHSGAEWYLSDWEERVSQVGFILLIRHQSTSQLSYKKTRARRKGNRPFPRTPHRPRKAPRRAGDPGPGLRLCPGLTLPASRAGTLHESLTLLLSVMYEAGFTLALLTSHSRRALRRDTGCRGALNTGHSVWLPLTLTPLHREPGQDPPLRPCSSQKAHRGPTRPAFSCP